MHTASGSQGRRCPGGFISLLNGAGEAVEADFTAAGGAFSLVAPGPGEYRIRVERIGYAMWVTQPYTLVAGQTLAVTVEVPPNPVRLVDLRVEVTASCLDDPRQRVALATVWEEARKALETAVWAEDRGEVSFTLTEYKRTLDPRSLTTLESETRTRPGVRLPPFRSLPATRLLAEGYAIVSADSSVFYAPDAAVLLSEEFREAHCFGLRRDDVEGEERLGITFRPQRPSEVVGIEGTVWLDEKSAALREVRLQYTGVPLPPGAEGRWVGANLVFDRLPDGPFYVRDWWIRFPMWGRARLPGNAARSRLLGSEALAARSRTGFVAYRQTGGSVTDARVSGVPLETGEGVVAGVLRDSVSGEPLSGADIVLRDWDDAAAFLPRPEPAAAPFSTVTDEAGAFRLAGLPDGVYALGVYHPRLWRAGIRLSEKRVVVDDRRSEPVELWTPSTDPRVAAYRQALQRRSEECGERASLAVSVRDESGLVSMPRAVVALRFSDAEQPASREPADADGRFFLCAPPDARQATLWAEFSEVSGEEALVTLEPGQVHEVQLRLPFGETRTGRLVGQIQDARTGQPIAAAEISVGGRREVVQSNRTGHFVLSALTAGKHELSVRHLGYAQLRDSVAVEGGLTTEVDLGLSPNPLELEPLVATVIRPRELEVRGFYERRHWGELNGAGTFFTAEDIERRNPARITHMIADAPGIRIADCDVRGRGCKLFSTRLSSGFSDRPCMMNVYLDGVLVMRSGDDRWGGGSPVQSVNEYVLPTEIAGIEVYRGAAALPAEFSGFDSRCGAVVIWTK